jgi:hypothetical protein
MSSHKVTNSAYDPKVCAALIYNSKSSYFAVFDSNRSSAVMKYSVDKWQHNMLEGRDSQLLLPVAVLEVKWEKRGKEELHSFCQTTKRNRRGSYFERFREMKMNRRAFMSINRMRAGHASLKASLNRFNFVSTAEYQCGDGLQTEEHIFWGCKRYEDQRATTMDILSENSKNYSHSRLQSS